MSLPSRERGLKCPREPPGAPGLDVAPFAGAWMEMSRACGTTCRLDVAPFAGAWIEMATVCVRVVLDEVAPFAGAWIEMPAYGMP